MVLESVIFLLELLAPVIVVCVVVKLGANHRNRTPTPRQIVVKELRSIESTGSLQSLGSVGSDESHESPVTPGSVRRVKRFKK